ncbi:MAG: hypothetical protein JJ960_18360 [Kordiimonadaceae bacterium]|nr:hypothetical protein [Kordiimonadaceae bacterium]
MRDFTLNSYVKILDTLVGAGFSVHGVANWVEGKHESGACIRHDVDRKPKNALAMAKKEFELGIASTYYFRIVRSSFCARTVEQIAELGHEIGYHYEDVSLAGGNVSNAVELFKANLSRLRSIAPIKTVVMHGRPLSKHNNMAIWDHISLQDVDLIADALMSINYERLPYFTDTGRQWGALATNLRDRPETGAFDMSSSISTTDDLCQFIQAGSCRAISLAVHPERWSNDRIDWTGQLIKDTGANLIKRGLHFIR